MTFYLSQTYIQKPTQGAQTLHAFRPPVVAMMAVRVNEQKYFPPLFLFFFRSKTTAAPQTQSFLPFSLIKESSASSVYSVKGMRASFDHAVHENCHQLLLSGRLSLLHQRPGKERSGDKRDWRVCVREKREEGRRKWKSGVFLQTIQVVNGEARGWSPSEIEEKGEINISGKLPSRYL